MGRALAQWQYVEAGMFLLVLGIMKTEYMYSSTAFFILKVADVKLQLLNRLCEAHFPDTVIKNEWTPILKQLREAFAINWLTSRSTTLAILSTYRRAIRRSC